MSSDDFDYDEPFYILFEGDIITCEEGHKVYRVVRDIESGDGVHGTDFESLHHNLEDPMDGEPIYPNCPEEGCESFWAVMTADEQVVLHIEGQGWV